ncbi:HotDog domain-containing protein [Scheffersomyces xylosifermentans]|uniref:HotDog domain-containing protein n=1 Tax=Scheffersomyces xylosifermentans TaxID=1304137 RepID=UPI00315DE1F6
MFTIRRANCLDKTINSVCRTRNSYRLGGVAKTRNYGTRSEHDSPFDHMIFRKKPWISWKTTVIFFAFGSFLAYNETLFNTYEKFTTLDEKDSHNNDILPMQLEYKLKNLPIYQQLSHPKNADKWFKLQSWENLDHNVLDNSTVYTNEDERREKAVKVQNEYREPTLTTSTLAKPGGILIKPVIFHNIETNEGVTIVHAGFRLCGYPFIIHGGMIATLLNETFKRNASLTSETSSNLKDDFKVENLTINYKYPTFANQFLIVKTRKKESVENDKKTIRLVSVIEDTKGRTLVKSEALLHDTGRATNWIKEKEKNKSWIPFT